MSAASALSMAAIGQRLEALVAAPAAAADADELLRLGEEAL